ncbi:hypothetical protein ACFLY9_02285 [Patescibacteria group bacterium]
MKKVKKFVVNVASKASVFSGIAGTLMFGLAKPAFAVEYTFLPDYLNEILTKVTADPQDYVNNRVKAALTVLFIVVFIIAIVYSALAAIKFISSQGDASKLEESKGAVKAILMGFAAMLIAIVGLLVVLWVLGASSTPGEEIPIDQP